MTGIDKARETANKIKEETEATQEVKDKNMEVAKDSLAVLGGNAELAKMYQENASLGSDNLGGSLPQLKVHATGRSTTNELSDGNEPNDGYFFYKPTGEQFETLECHILTISRGYRAEGLQGKKNVFHQVLGGVIIHGDELKPFLMYFTGTRLSYLWDFGKEASKYTHAKPLPIPMFALTVKFSTEKITTDYGKNWIVKFEIAKNDDGSPKLVMDPNLFRILRENVETLENTITSLIEAKAAPEEEAPIIPIDEDPGPTGDQEIDL